MDTIADLNNKLRTFGYVVLRNVIDKDAILRCRRMLSSSLPRVDRFVSHFSNPDELPLAKDLGYELFYGEKIKDVLGGLLEAHGVAILPPFEVMQNHFATHSWHRDSGGERSLDLNCSDLTDPNYRLGKIAIFLQSDTRHFGGSIEVIPYSHRLAGSTKNTLRYWRMGDFLAHILNLAPKVQLRRQLLVRILRRFIVRNLKFRAGDVVLFDSRLLHSSLPTSEATKVKFQSSVREDEILLADQDKKLAIYVQYGNSLAFRSYLRYRLQDSNYPGVDNAELFQHPIRPFIGVDDGAYFDYLSMAHETKEWKRGNSS